MSAPLDSLAALLDPVSEAEFFADYFDRRPLHVPAPRPDKLADAVSWPVLTRLLNMSGVWSPTTLRLQRDGRQVPPPEYCREDHSREGQYGLLPDAPKVLDLLRDGAALIANDIDTLHPGLMTVAGMLESAFGAKTQANLYCSWEDRQAFVTHFDSHAVFALHGEGEKVWRIYANRVERPVAHPMFDNIDREQARRERGDLLMEVTLRPGDVLYIPRGYYHDALASSAGAVHVAFGVTHPNGVDLVNLLPNYAVTDPLFRAYLPLPGAEAGALRAQLHGLADRLSEVLKSETMLEQVQRFQAGYRYPRGGYELPGAILAQRYTLNASDALVVAEGAQQVLRTRRGTVPIPDGLGPMVAWVADRPGFTGAEFATEFADVPAARRDKVLTDLVAMKVIVAA